ncbi:MAG: redoxin domain-containing protein [Verrucomicrobiota bacterium]|nr:redoxin domain-containing protein [Verrucomicrobiota bacterium]
MRLLAERLVRLQSSELRPFSSDDLRDTRVFAFYYAGAWCPACRKFTPLLIEWYRRTKAEHPEFELIWVTNDRSELTMAEYMRKAQMPWPAVRFDKADQTVRQFAGDGIPWLVAVSDTGKPLTTNGTTKQYLDPVKVMEGIEFLLAQLRSPQR